MKEIDVKELKQWKDSEKKFQLIDVREPFERNIATIDGLNIPIEEILPRINEISEEYDVVIYCRSGKRSANAINQIQKVITNNNLYNLKGGILAWADEIDNTLEKY